MVSGAQLDAQQTAQFNALLAGLESTSNANNPQYQRFLQDLQTASVAMNDLSNRYAGRELTWSNGDPITAHGDPVTAFQATEAQYQDGTLFGQSGSGLLGSTANYWRQYGSAQGTEHLWESLAFGFESENAGLYDQAFNSVLGGRVEPFTLIDETVIDVVSGGGASAATKIAARATNPKQVADWLRTRVSGAVAPNRIATQADVAGHFQQNRQFWSSDPIPFNGNRVYQRGDLIDPNKVDPRTGRTNLELMQAGRAPLGPDGKAVNLHHLTQRQDGAIAEVSQTLHSNNHGTLHMPNTMPSGINRTEFNAWRRNYWKNRANDF